MENHKTTNKHHRVILKEIAHRAMLERGLLPDFSTEALAELGLIKRSMTTDGNTIRDLRNLMWASIDNDDSRDLDQLTVAEAVPDSTKHEKTSPCSRDTQSGNHRGETSVRW